MRFVVTGTGRSGTGYTAALFTAAGLPCGHEDLFTTQPAGRERGAPRSGVIARAKEPLGRLRESRKRAVTSFAGDSSWMAAPRLAGFRGVSFLQTRHPLPVIRSFMGTRFFSDPTKCRAQHRYAAAFLPPTGDDVLDAMRWWVYWNELAAEHATRTYRLEDLDTELFAELLGLVGGDPDRADDAFTRVARDVNSSHRRGDKPGEIEWSDLPKGKARDDLERAAERFGY